jgi:hypothetical protein
LFCNTTVSPAPSPDTVPPTVYSASTETVNRQPSPPCGLTLSSFSVVNEPSSCTVPHAPLGFSPSSVSHPTFSGSTMPEFSVAPVVVPKVTSSSLFPDRRLMSATGTSVISSDDRSMLSTWRRGLTSARSQVTINSADSGCEAAITFHSVDAGGVGVYQVLG